MVVAAGAEKRGARHALRDLESEHAVVEGYRALEVGHFEMDVTDVDPRINALRHTWMITSAQPDAVVAILQTIRAGTWRF